MNMRQKVWEYAKAHPLCNAQQLSRELSLSIVQVRDALHGLVQKELMMRVKGTGHVSSPYLYKTTGSEPCFGKGKSPSKKVSKRFNKTNRQKLWNNMKISRKFTISELLSTISVGESTARNFVTYLLKTGYVVEKSRLPSKKRLSVMNGKEIEWLLIRDTGRLAPIVRKDGCWDQNEQKMYLFPIVQNGRSQQVGKEESNDMA